MTHYHRKLGAFVGSTALLLLASSPQALAQLTTMQERFGGTSVDRSFNSAPKDCAEVQWSEAALRAFPRIGDACQAVEERNGKTYVKLQGEVEEVEDQGKRIRVDFQDGSELTFTPTPRTALYLDGERTEFSQVDEGMSLNFYIPEDRLQAELQPNPERLAFVVIPLEGTAAPIPAREQSMAQTSEREEQRDAMRASTSDDMNELPRTAGLLPWLGAGGGLLMLFGAIATFVRRLR